jgi:hypothetical protein
MIVTWAKKNNPALLDLIGEVLPGDKTRVPLQAADLAMWHVRRQEAGESEQIDKLRLYGMFKDRSMVLNEINNDDLEAIGRKAADLRWRSQLEARRATGDGA